MWECDFPFGKPRKKTPCPECEGKCEQNWAGRDVPIHFKGSGWSGVNKNTGLNKTGGSDEINLKLQDGCNERMDSGWQHYKKYTPPQEVFDKARKLTPQESVKKMEVAKKIMDETYDRAGINPTHKYKPQ